MPKAQEFVWQQLFFWFPFLGTYQGAEVQQTMPKFVVSSERERGREKERDRQTDRRRQRDRQIQSRDLNRLCCLFMLHLVTEFD